MQVSDRIGPVMRLYKHMKQMKERGRIIYNPDPICCIKVSETWSQLRTRVLVE